MDTVSETTTNSSVSTQESACSKDIFLFSNPRTASNLLCRLLEGQPGWTQSSYHFDEALGFAKTTFGFGPIIDITDDQRQEFYALLQSGFDKLEEQKSSANSKGTHILVKNHSFMVWEPSDLSQGAWGGAAAPPFRASSRSKDGSESTSTNPTFFPDEFLMSWIPLILIRHPALAFESWYRAEIRAAEIDILYPAWGFVTTYRHSRQLYDWFIPSGNSISPDEKSAVGDGNYSGPIVIDADDIIDKQCLTKLCKLCNMDPALICYEWEKTKAPEDGSVSARHISFMSGLWNSVSIDKSKSSHGLDMTKKQAQWKAEFGATVADALYKMVESAMPDYTYLKAKKI